MHGYRRTFNISHYSVSFKEIKDKTLLSYQPLQSLNLNQTQIEALCEETINTITKISTNVNEFIKYRGLLEEVNEDGEVIENSNNKTVVPPYYKALQQNKNLFYDDYIQEKIQADIKGFKERTYKGCLFCEGNYQTLIPDIVGLAEYAFGLDPKGCLQANEVYSRYWLGHKAKKVGIVRFPHIAREWRIGKVVNSNSKYLKYMTEGVVTSMYDTIALALNSADYDGDKILTISTKELVEQAEEELANTITFIPMKKTKIYNIEKIILDEKYKEYVKLKPLYNPEPKKRRKPKKKIYRTTEPKTFRINNMNKVIKTDCIGMSNNIGNVVNKISKLWMLMGEASGEEKKRIYDYIKIMSVMGSLTIDFVKTGVKAPIPKEIEEYLKDVKKPFFMKVKYKDQAKKENKINKNLKILDKESIELFSDNDCTMNRIYHYMQNKLENIDFDKGDNTAIGFAKLIKSKINIYNESYKQTFQTMMKLKVEYDKISQEKVFDKEFLQDKKTENEYKWRMFYSYCRVELLNICANKKYQMNIEQMLEYLIYIHYCDKKFTENNDSKAILWNVFGEELNQRIKGIDLVSKEIRTGELNKKIKKIKGAVKKQKKKQEDIYIKMFAPKDKKDIKDIEIYQSEIKCIKKEVEGFEKRKMMFVLLVLEKFSAAYTGKSLVNIYVNKKNTINRTHILKLTGIDKRKYDDTLQMLNKLKFIELGIKKQGELLTCKVKDIEISGEKFIIQNINECKKYLKKLK